MAETSETPEPPDFTARLPNEILIDQIFGRLGIKSRLKSRETCKRWASVVSIVEGQGSLLIGRLMGPCRQDIDADQINSALRSILVPSVLSGEGENLKHLSFNNAGRIFPLDKTTLELIVDFCSNLTSLDLINVDWSMSDVSGFNWLSFSRLTHLSEFHMECCCPETNELQSCADLIQLLSNRPQLAKLSILHSPISDAQLKEICRNSPTISTLNISGSEKLVDFSPIATLSGLQKLDIQWTHVSDDQLELICTGCPQVTQLDLQSCRLLTDFSPIATLSKLQRLKMQCTQVSNEQLELICTGCSQLTQLHLVACHSLTHFKCLANLQHLKSLTVGTNFNDDQGKLVPGSLEDVGVCGPDNFTDSGLKALSRKCPELKSLNLVRCGSVTDASLSDLASNCPKLKSVKFDGTAVSGEGLQLLGKCKYLRTVEFWSELTVDDIHSLQKSRQDNSVTTLLDLHVDESTKISPVEQVRFFLSDNIRIVLR